MDDKKTEKQIKNRRKPAFLLLVVVAGIVAALLYFEQAAIIYVLSTLALVTLLLVVAFADLESVGSNRETSSPTKTKAIRETLASEQNRS